MPNFDAKFKIREAKFFLQHLRQEQKKLSGLDRKSRRTTSELEPLRFYFSAFLSAAVSIVFRLECQDKLWVSNWRKALHEEEANFFNRIQGERGREVHSIGANTPVTETPFVRNYAPSIQVLPYEVFWADGIQWDEHSAMVTWQIPVYSLEIRGTRAEIIRSCERYLNLVRQLLLDWDARTTS